MNIGERIKRRREQLGLSQSELARMVGYTSRSTINKIEKDGRGISQNKIVDIARALKVTPSYLMGWEELEDANTEDDYDELYREYGDDARAFHKKLQEFAAAYDNAMLNYDEEKYASELENLKGKSDEDILDNQDFPGKKPR